MRRADRLAVAFAVALVCSLALPGAAQKISPGAVLQVTWPDFRGFADGQYIFITNPGEEDFTGALEVKATCKSTAPRAPANACGPNFPNGTFLHNVAKFPPGHGPGVAPVKGSGNAQQASGPGWVAIFMNLPPGTYEIAGRIDPKNLVNEKDETNNSFTNTVTIAAAAPPGSITVNPAVVRPKAN